MIETHPFPAPVDRSGRIHSGKLPAGRFKKYNLPGIVSIIFETTRFVYCLSVLFGKRTTNRPQS